VLGVLFSIPIFGSRRNALQKHTQEQLAVCSDRTIAAIRIWNGTTLASTETIRISTEYMRDNAIETSRIAANDAKMLEEATHISDTTSSSKSS
jgi:hypothetical protein